MKIKNIEITPELLEELDENCEGLCLACGETSGGCEPDAENYTCESCGQDRVTGPHWLLLETMA